MKSVINQITFLISYIRIFHIEKASLLYVFSFAFFNFLLISLFSIDNSQYSYICIFHNKKYKNPTERNVFMGTSIYSHISHWKVPSPACIFMCIFFYYFELTGTSIKTEAGEGTWYLLRSRTTTIPSLVKIGCGRIN